MASSPPAPAALGTGSLWNPNSWHWETRAYSAWGAASLHAALLPLRVAAGPLAVRITGITALSLDASVSIRRGRKYVVWELSKLSLSWVGYAPSGAVDRETAGTLSLGAGGVSNEDAGGEFGMRMTHTGTTAFDTSCRDIAAGGLVPLVRRTVREWAAALARHDDALEAQAIAHRDAAAITPAGVAAAAAKVAAARASAPTLLPQPQVVAEERAGSERVVEGATEGAACGTQRGASGVAVLGGGGVEQGGLAAVGTAADAGAPAQPSETSAGASAAPERPSEAGAAAPSAGNGGGSAWNPNAFLWEERSLTSWATDRLSQLIGGIDIDVPGGSIKIVETKLKGDASVSLRRGKKFVFFEFTISCLWEGELVSESTGLVRAQGDGRVRIPDVDQDSAKAGDYSIEVTVEENADKADHVCKEVFRQHGVAALRAKVDIFFADVFERASAYNK